MSDLSLERRMVLPSSEVPDEWKQPIYDKFPCLWRPFANRHLVYTCF